MFVIKYKRMCNLKLVHRSMYGNEDDCPKEVADSMKAQLLSKTGLAEREQVSKIKKMEIPKEGFVT